MEHNEKVALQKLKKEVDALRAECAVSEKDAQAEAQAADGQSTPKTKEEQRQSFIRAQEKWLNEYVEIRLFKDNEKYKDDVYVAINGKNCVIRRGVWTRIRRKFALLLDQSEIQDLRTAELIAGEALHFAEESRKRGL